MLKVSDFLLVHLAKFSTIVTSFAGGEAGLLALNEKSERRQVVFFKPFLAFVEVLSETEPWRRS
ncbi:hypothetical protein B6V74_09530 [Thioclava sp. F42-5]|nr:hypothetical protein B6V74_09530 [Thioclava sp. F42-5]